MRRLAAIFAASILAAVGVQYAAASVTPTPKPVPYSVRVDMIGCGQHKSVSVLVGKNVLFVNAGTAVRHVYSMSAPMPQWGLKRGMWFAVKSQSAWTFKISERHTGCATASVFTVNVKPLTTA